MSVDRFRTAYNISEYSSAEESENPFRNIQATTVPTGQGASQVIEGKQYNPSSLQAIANISRGDLAITKDSLNFSVPIEFIFSGRKYLVSISSNISARGGKLYYVINAGDKSGLRIIFATDNPVTTIASSPGPRKQYGKFTIK